MAWFGRDVLWAQDHEPKGVIESESQIPGWRGLGGGNVAGSPEGWCWTIPLP